jgi:transcription factor MYB, plant
VQKHAKQLNCDVNSKRFKDAMRFLWMPRLAERAATAAHQPQPQHVAAACNNVLVAAAAANSSSCCWSSPRSSAVTTAACSGSSSCSSLTSESAHNDDDGARPHAAAVLAAAAGDDDYWGAVTTTMQQQQQQQNEQYDFWSTASALQHLTTAAADQDLTGWVQGFSDDGILSGSSSDSLWSLDDIWRMQ